MSDPASTHKMGHTEWSEITDAALSIHGPLLVTNNPDARTAFGDMSHCWVVSMVHKEDDGSYSAFIEGWTKIHSLRMFAKVVPPSLSRAQHSGGN